MIINQQLQKQQSKINCKHSVKIIEGGFFSRNYEVYGIKYSLSKGIVYRSQVDFNDLRDALIKLCPGYVVPPLTTKPIQKLEPEYINARKAELQIFLYRLLEHPLLKNLDEVWKFISLEDEKAYKTAKNEMMNIKKPVTVSEYTTVEGKTNVMFDDNLEQTCNEINIGLNDIVSEFKK